MVPFVFSGNRLSVSVKGRVFIIPNNDFRFQKVLDAIRNDIDENALYEICVSKPEIRIEDRAKVGAASVQNGKLYFNGKELYNSIANRVNMLVQQGLPVDSLLRFVENIELNPSFAAKNEFYDFLEHQDLVITEDGYVLAYKSVRPDYMDWYTGTINNKPGEKPKMTRNNVDDNRNRHCSSGLHVGAIGYVTSYGHSDKKIVVCKVHPKDVVSVPNDCSCQKCRVCEYEVLHDMKEVHTAPLYSSKGEPYNPNVEFKDWESVCDADYDEDYKDDSVYDYEEDELVIPPVIKL